MRSHWPLWSTAIWLALMAGVSTGRTQAPAIGREVAIARHLEDGEEFRVPIHALLEHGRKLFTAVWTVQEGGGSAGSTTEAEDTTAV